MKKKDHLPTFGIGPVYGAIIIALTVAGIIASNNGLLDFGKYSVTELPLLVIGIILIPYGVSVWYRGAFRLDRYLYANKLCTEGIYASVRNPCYSGIMLMCTGALLIANNIVLLVLPFAYWLFMTILLKNTEEKWLLELYKEEYTEYCKRVNRCIPWFKSKR